MNKLGRNKRNWLKKQGCVFVDDKRIDPTKEGPYTQIWTSHGEYVGLADLGKHEQTVNFIYKHRLTNLMSINRAQGKSLSKTGCNAVTIGFNEKEQTWYGWTHRGFGKFYIGYRTTKGSIMDNGEFSYPFVIETLEQAKRAAIYIADFLN